MKKRAHPQNQKRRNLLNIERLGNLILDIGLNLMDQASAVRQ
jgi:hypothetical protein